MKDLYSFNSSEKDFLEYYDKVKTAYFKIFERCGVPTVYTMAAGGDFTDSNTHEFQAIADVGEDTIFVCNKCRYAENDEISKLKVGDKCRKCDGQIEQKKSIEVGNIFPLGTRYSEPLGLKFTDENGNKKPVIMGSYGIGISRLMGTIVELHYDDKGILWPENVSPFRAHLIALDEKNNETEKIYHELESWGLDIIYDNRNDKTPGEKFADADLIGCPVRLVISAKTLEKDSIEIKERNKKELKLIKLSDLGKEFNQF